MKDEHRAASRHQLDHVVPTVIHDPEQDMPVLARWLRHAMENQTRFWGLVAALVVVVTGLAIASHGLSLGRSATDAAWIRLETAQTPSERVEIAREFPKTPVEQWALLQAATEYYNQGFIDLPANRDAALPALRKALDLFEEVAREAPQDSPQARTAALGAARTLEARNELEKAIKQYDKVASTWKGTPEADAAQARIEALRRPENVAFYKELYAYKPVEATLPPAGQGGITLPPNHPPIDAGTLAPSSSSTFPSPLSLPPPPISGAGGAGATGGTTKTELDPTLLPPPPPSPAPRPEAPKDKDNEAEKDQEKKGELPSDPFAPRP